MDLSAPVYANGPCIDIQDPPHARKTLRNNEITGTHLIVLGKATITYGDLVELYRRSVLYASKAASCGRTPVRIIKARDIFNVDKQDDGAARRAFHAHALFLMTEKKGEETVIAEGFDGLFVMQFVYGKPIELQLRVSYFDIRSRRTV